MRVRDAKKAGYELLAHSPWRHRRTCESSIPLTRVPSLHRVQNAKIKRSWQVPIYQRNLSPCQYSRQIVHSNSCLPILVNSFNSQHVPAHGQGVDVCGARTAGVLREDEGALACGVGHNGHNCHNCHNCHTTAITANQGLPRVCGVGYITAN